MRSLSEDNGPMTAVNKTHQEFLKVPVWNFFLLKMIKHCWFFIFHYGFALVFFLGGNRLYDCSSFQLPQNLLLSCGRKLSLSHGCTVTPSSQKKNNKTKLDGTKLLCWQNMMAASHRAGLFEGGFPSENKSWLINGRVLDFFYFFFTCEQMCLPLCIQPWCSRSNRGGLVKAGSLRLLEYDWGTTTTQWSKWLGAAH